MNIDFSKDHIMLMRKLDVYYIKQNGFKRLKIFLLNRKASTEVNSYKYKFQTIMKVVPK